MIDPLKIENASDQVLEMFEKYQETLRGSINYPGGVIPLGDLWNTAASLTLATILLSQERD